ncbi:hypothetical protein AWE51_08380 [Aquimarina aggregata]|uniref:Uncharacterized protein n=1 Tax=Aquimarina aggregata TaxID=1642818 RepID=A0A162ZA26_9FLAO|nr:family 16 glycoside hydrolase [Aquimarina aggregata]KZS39658.1 hypothetical protein AWE51_08380 [Aquimarina aggregata]
MKNKYFIIYVITALLSLTSATAQEQLWKGTFEGWDFGFKDGKGNRDEFWKIQPNGELHAIGGTWYDRQSGMRTAKPYSNYELTLEYKWLTPGSGDRDGNSGIWIHGENNFAQDNGGFPNSIEVQLKKGEAGDLLRKGMDIKARPGYLNKGKYGNGRIRHEQLPRRSDPKGTIEYFHKEWNTMTIRCEEDLISVYLNGFLINQGNVFKNGKAVTSGFITLQSELKNLAFRNIYIEEIENTERCSISPIVYDKHGITNNISREDDYAEIEIGGYVVLCAITQSEGTWTWTGPNNFSDVGRCITIPNVQEDQLGIYTATFAGINGCNASHNFEIGLEKDISGTYHFINVKTKKYLDADPNTVVKQGNNEANDNDTHWNLIPSTPGYFFIDNDKNDRGPLMAASSLHNSISYEAEELLMTPAPRREWKAIKVGYNTYQFLCKDEARGYLTAVVGNEKVINTNNLIGDGVAIEWELIPVSNSKKSDNKLTINKSNHSNILVTQAANNGSFTVHFNGQKISDLIIYNMTGQNVYKKTFGEQKPTSHLLVNQNFVSGIYILQTIDANGNTKSTKFMVD